MSSSRLQWWHMTHLYVEFGYIWFLLVHQINHVMTKSILCQQQRRRYVLVSVESNQRIFFFFFFFFFVCLNCLDGIDTEVAVCTIPWLLLAFEAEQNGRTTLKISFVMTWLLFVQFKMNLQIIILPKPLLHAWHLRMLNLFMEVTKVSNDNYI